MKLGLNPDISDPQVEILSTPLSPSSTYYIITPCFRTGYLEAEPETRILIRRISGGSVLRMGVREVGEGRENSKQGYYSVTPAWADPVGNMKSLSEFIPPWGKGVRLRHPCLSVIICGHPSCWGGTWEVSPLSSDCVEEGGSLEKQGAVRR